MTKLLGSGHATFVSCAYNNITECVRDNITGLVTLAPALVSTSMFPMSAFS